MGKALSIDFGTTKIAVAVVDENRTLLACAASAHQAGISLPNGVEEEDTEKIIQCAWGLIRDLPAELRSGISSIGITGQMHSVLLLKDNLASRMVSWQDHRCGEAMLKRFQQKSGYPLREGFGGTTLTRLAEEGLLPPNCPAATIADYAGFLLCENTHIITDPTHAASWGLYDLKNGTWDRKALNALCIPEKIMPEIRESGCMIGKVSAGMAEKLGLPAGIPVCNAIGDNQASVLGTGNQFDHEIYLTLGTGGQLSMVVEKLPDTLAPNLEIRPFPGGRWLLVSAPLCGGSAFAFLADMINQFRHDLGESPVDRGILLGKIDELALSVLKNGSLELTAKPHFLGERYDLSLKGAFEGLTLTNATPGQMGAALAVGIIRNLKKGFPAEAFEKRKCVIGSGNAVRRLKSIQYVIRNEFNMELCLPDSCEEAAVGAAVLSLKTCKSSRQILLKSAHFA